MPDWRFLSNRAANIAGTPCYVMSEACVLDNLTRLRQLETSVPLRHWLSLKSQPLKKLAISAGAWGLGVEVVSEFELAGVLRSGVPAAQVLVNGVGKQSWLRKYLARGLCVHFDSLQEVKELAPLARDLSWNVGVRCAIPNSGVVRRAEVAETWDQFGMTEEEVLDTCRILRGLGIAIKGAHFHLRSSVPRVSEFKMAVEHVAELFENIGTDIEYLDIGGGLPVMGEALMDGSCAAHTFDFLEFRAMLARIPVAIPSVRKVWLENGRFLTATAGTLVVTVVEKKVRRDAVYLICDGGRVNHARPSAWEAHDLSIAPPREGTFRKTVVCGPTCGAIDRLGCWMLPEDVAVGDRVIWSNAGAYHLPLETRFSVGVAPVVWFDETGEPHVLRSRETPEEWWGAWT